MVDSEKKEIEITPEMIEAGVKALHNSGRLGWRVPSADADLVGDIIFSAFSAAPLKGADKN